LAALERALDVAVPFTILTALNVITLSTYIYACFATYFFFFMYFALDIAEDRLPENKRYLIKYGVPMFIIGTLFFNFWINNEKSF